MESSTINIRRTGTILKPDASRVLLRPLIFPNEQRSLKIIARIMLLSESEVFALLKEVLAEFSERHQQIRNLFLARFERVKNFLVTDREISEERKLLIGSHFIQEYSLESAALFNPSIVPHPDQSDLPPGALRFILSLRATGEGHISSLTFRTGTVDANHRIDIHKPTRYVTEPHQIPNASYEKSLFERKLYELGFGGELAHRVIATLGESFTLVELRAALGRSLKQQGGGRTIETDRVARGMLLLVESNYEVQFEPDQRFSERVIFPSSPTQSNGIEDARFVRFQNDDGTVTYYATYTAFDGKIVLPQLLETQDFLRFKFITLNGPAVQNKGMALFPRKINEHYTMLSRQDGENLYLMFSDNIHFWNTTQMLMKPTFPWEFVQIGNCGSPIETEAGWLALSHGVGAMRKYCIGAVLLDRDNPAKIIGRLSKPLIKPSEEEREGYVPNVVYTCGMLLHNDVLIIPYAMSDYSTGFATIPLKEILAAME